MVDGGYNVAVWSSCVRIRCWIFVFATLYTKVQPPIAILAQGNDGEDIAWVGMRGPGGRGSGSWAGRHLETLPQLPSHSLILNP